MNIFITGGSGFLGRQVIQRLILGGHRVGALVRSEASSKIVEELGATPILGDMTEIEGFSNRLSEFSVVVHCAAPVEFWGPWEKYQRGIIDSTMTLANECCKQKVKRFIFISSESVLQGTSELLEINEEHPYPPMPNSSYGRAKKITEEGLLKIQSQMEIIILRPSFIWGPNCKAIATISNKLKSGRFLWVDQGKKQFEAVHVENVVEAIWLALTKGKNRAIYFVTDDEEATVRAFFENIFNALNLKVPTNSAPGFLLRPLASVIEILWQFFQIKKAPPISRFELAFVDMARKYNIDRIKSELHYHPVIDRVAGFKQLAAVQ